MDEQMGSEFDSIWARGNGQCVGLHRLRVVVGRV
jgi:hypothetical protein